jgi:hypothetical protein
MTNKGDDDPFDDPLWQQADATVTKRSRPDQYFIGCPLPWFKSVLSVVHGKNELAVALYLYRLWKVFGSRTVVVSNERLLAELGIDRYAKYRALRRLAEAGIITLKRQNKHAIQVTIQRQPRRAGRTT